MFHKHRQSDIAYFCLSSIHSENINTYTHVFIAYGYARLNNIEFMFSIPARIWVMKKVQVVTIKCDQIQKLIDMIANNFFHIVAREIVPPVNRQKNRLFSNVAWKSILFFNLYKPHLKVS